MSRSDALRERISLMPALHSLSFLASVPRRLGHAVLLLLGLWSGTLQAASAAATAAAAPAPPPAIAASSYLLIDAETLRVLVEQNSRAPLPPASLTKIMTAYVAEIELASGRIKLSDDVPVSVNAWQAEGSRMFIQEGTTVPLEKLLRGVIISSGNDASIAIAEYIAGSESAFADMMNEQARKLGMTDTHFENATGLPAPEHRTTAHDLALLTRALIREFPEHYAIYAEKSFTFNGIDQPNRNRLLWRDRTVDGVKTGHTEEAGFCLVASAKREDQRLISVVMGTESDEARMRESQKLLSYGFRYFQTHRLYEGGVPLKTARVWYGTADEVGLGAAETVTVTITRGAYDSLKAELVVPNAIEAPLEKGQALGRLVLRLGEETVADVPLVALDAVEEAGFFSRIVDFLLLLFANLFTSDETEAPAGG
jgi:D-alanyl-D-alanine carboxypeptidase (penicillin-binding protein 5/6)